MSSGQSVPWKCFFVAWVFGWVAAIYAPSLLIALTGLSPPSGSNILAATFAVADEVAPAVKLAYGALTGAAWLATHRLRHLPSAVLAALHTLLALTVMLLVLAAMPHNWSRGFGIGLTGERFDTGPTMIYVAGALLSGLVFSLSQARCAARRREHGEAR